MDKKTFLGEAGKKTNNSSIIKRRIEVEHSQGIVMTVHYNLLQQAALKMWG